jgi:AraC family transcriptional regulator
MSDRRADHEGGSALHQPTIERVVRLMRDRLHEPLALDDLAAEAYLSPFHFSRIFRQATGAPPGEFLGALRLDAARRLLLTTPASVTEICYEVGYSSLGSFTTRFTREVGLPPGVLRRMAAEFEPDRLGAIAEAVARRSHRVGATISGQVTGAPERGLSICIGLFPRTIPTGLPVACVQLDRPGPFAIRGVPEGVYALLAAALPWSDDPRHYFAPADGLLVAGVAPVAVSASGAARILALTLRPARSTDPPVVAALPLLLARWAPRSEHAFEERKIGEAPAASAR